MQISFDVYFEHLGLAASVGLSLYVLAGLAARIRETHTRRMHLWAMVAFFGVNILDAIDSFAYSPAFSGPPILAQWQDVLIPTFMVSLYFFVRGLTSSDPQLGRGDWVHVLPFIAALLCLAPSLMLPGEVRMGLIEPAVSADYMLVVESGGAAFWVLWIIVLIIYGGLCVRRLVRHKRNIRDLFSDLSGRSLVWLDALVATIFVMSGIVILDETMILLGYEQIRVGAVSMLYDFVLTAAFAWFALRASPPLPQWSHEVISFEVTQPEDTAASDVQRGGRYSRSGLSEEDLIRFADRLDQRVKEKQLWRDHNLNLRKLASEISVLPIHLSEVLNTRLDLSFYDYVNQCRVKDACDLLASTDMPVLEVSETVGFNSKSTFNSSFKKVTQQTPSQWRSTHRG